MRRPRSRTSPFQKYQSDHTFIAHVLDEARIARYIETLGPRKLRKLHDLFYG